MLAEYKFNNVAAQLVMSSVNNALYCMCMVVRQFSYACARTFRVCCRLCIRQREMDSFEVDSCIRGYHVYVNRRLPWERS